MYLQQNQRKKAWIQRHYHKEELYNYIKTYSHCRAHLRTVHFLIRLDLHYKPQDSHVAYQLSSKNFFLLRVAESCCVVFAANQK